MKKLNLGCGNDIKKGWINLDIAALEGIDVVHDLSKLPLPFEDNSIDEVLCQDVLEHLEYIDLLKDIHRILKKGGLLKARIPHFTSRNNFIDPTHKKTFSFQTFQFFVKESLHDRSYYFDFHFEKLVSTYITFEKGYFIYNHLIEWFVNLNRKTKVLFESTFLCRTFPAENVIVQLKK